MKIFWISEKDITCSKEGWSPRQRNRSCSSFTLSIPSLSRSNIYKMFCNSLNKTFDLLQTDFEDHRILLQEYRVIPRKIIVDGSCVGYSTVPNSPNLLWRCTRSHRCLFWRRFFLHVVPHLLVFHHVANPADYWLSAAEENLDSGWNKKQNWVKEFLELFEIEF